MCHIQTTVATIVALTIVATMVSGGWWVVGAVCDTIVYNDLFRRKAHRRYTCEIGSPFAATCPRGELYLHVEIQLVHDMALLGWHAFLSRPENINTLLSEQLQVTLVRGNPLNHFLASSKPAQLISSS